MQRAELRPVMNGSRIIPEKRFKYCFMVAAQANCVPLHQPDRELVNYALRIRAAIDVVAEIDFERVLDGPSLKILIDAKYGFSEQVGPAVDVSDSIDARIRR